MRQVIKSKTVNKTDLELINKYSNRQLSTDEVFAFTVTLCDNDIDRDLEAFEDDALYKLAELMEGVTGIYDHNPTSKNQTARIYKTHVETTQDTTSFGTPRKMLKAGAYMVKSSRLKDVILEIDAGILKEVSIGCGIKKKVCSVCGKEYDGSCGHIKGRSYNNKLCYVKLCEPFDAYEWSFVAIPAQKRAGVTKKRYNKTKQNAFNLNPQTQYIKALRKDVIKLAFLSNFMNNDNAFASIVEKMDITELEAVKKEFTGQLKKTSPFLQLGRIQSSRTKEALKDLEDFKI